MRLIRLSSAVTALISLAASFVTASEARQPESQTYQLLPNLQLITAGNLPSLSSLNLTPESLHQRAIDRFSATGSSPAPDAADPAQCYTNAVTRGPATIRFQPTDPFAVRICLEYLYAASTADCAREMNGPLCTVRYGQEGKMMDADVRASLLRMYREGERKEEVIVECGTVARAVEQILLECSEGDGWGVEGAKVSGAKWVDVGEKKVTDVGVGEVIRVMVAGTGRVYEGEEGEEKMVMLGGGEL